MIAPEAPSLDLDRNAVSMMEVEEERFGATGAWAERIDAPGSFRPVDGCADRRKPE